MTLQLRHLLGDYCGLLRRPTSDRQVTPPMLLELTAVHKSLLAHHAPIRPFPRVDPSVQLKASAPREPPAANVAAVHLLPRVNHGV